MIGAKVTTPSHRNMTMTAVFAAIAVKKRAQRERFLYTVRYWERSFLTFDITTLKCDFGIVGPRRLSKTLYLLFIMVNVLGTTLS